MNRKTMNWKTTLVLTSSTLFLGLGSANAIETPTDLIEKLKAAIAAKNMQAASKLVEWGHAPIPAYRIFKMSLADCFPPAQCKIEVVEMSAEHKNPQGDYKFSVVPEGELKLIDSSVGGSDGFSMPFAKVGTEYKIIIGEPTEAGFAQTKASVDARKIAEELAPDLLTGEALPADGGGTAAAYRDYLAAIARNDTNFLAQHGTEGDRYFFGTAYKSNPTKAAINLDLIRLETIKEPTIKAGYVKDNRAVLLVSGANGQGWTTEGAVTFVRESNKWTIEDKTYLSYPPLS